LKAAAPAAQPRQQPQPMNPLCVATVNYGAGVGDISNEHVSTGPVFFGSVNIVMLPNATQVRAVLCHWFHQCLAQDSTAFATCACEVY
jgi:hypothetical protein